MNKIKKKYFPTIFKELGIKNIEELNNYFIPNLLSPHALRIILYKHALAILFYKERIFLYDNDEDLHQFRIHIRKSRAFLKEFKSLFPKKIYHYFYKHLSAFAAQTNQKRDLDVMRKYLLELDGEYGSMQELIKELQREEQQKIKRMLKDQVFNTFFLTYQNILKTNVLLKEDNKTIEYYAKKTINQLHLKIIEKIDALEQEYHDQELHTIRISLKKLRYLLEEFQQIFGTKKIHKMIKKGKKLQTLLGDFNDTVNQKKLFHDFIQLHKKNFPKREKWKKEFLGNTAKREEELKQKAMKKLHTFKGKKFKL